MKTEELTALGLTKEQADRVLAMNGRDVERVKGEAAAARGELEAANAELRQLREAAGKFEEADPERLQSELTALRQKYDADTASLRLRHAVDLALTAAQARSLKIVRGALDMSKLSLAGEEVAGLDEQLAALKSSDAYLFGEAQQTKGAPPPAKTGGGAQPTRDELSKMSDAEYFAATAAQTK